MQKTIISITTKINEIVVGLNNLMKGYQLELNFEENNDKPESQQETNTNVYKGTKGFIEQMMRDDETPLEELE
jgi:hypothetical protein